MEDVLNFLGVTLGAVAFIGCVERLGKINWFKSRPLSVMMYLTGTLWALWIVHDSVLSSLKWYQLGGLVFVLCFLWITRHRWSKGVPFEATKASDVINSHHRRKTD